MVKTAVVTGSSSGIGYETTLALARDGYNTYATMRDTSKGDAMVDLAKKEGLEISVVEMDVDSDASVGSAISDIYKESKRIDLLVNNAGYVIFGSAEDVTMPEYKSQFETNLFGVIRTVQNVAPIMRGQSKGHIVNVSSVAGRIGFPGTPAYISSKFALEGFSESIRYELGAFGIKVVIIEPGVVKSNFFNAMKIATPKADSPYREIIEKIVAGVKMMGELGTEPSEVAKIILDVIREKDPLPRYSVGNDAAMFLEAKRTKTDIEFENYLKKELYES